MLSFPFHLCRDLGADAGDFFLIKSISSAVLMFELQSRLEVIRLGAEFYRQIPFSALRSLYRQGNCLVLSVPRPILEYHNAEIHDTIALQWLNKGTLTGTLIKADVREYQEARNFNQFRQHKVPRGPRPKGLGPPSGEPIQ